MAFSETRLKRLKTAMAASDDRLRPFREKRLKLVREMAGSQYGESHDGRPVPVNLIELAVEIYLSYLAANAPRVLITTDVPWLKPMARTRELAVNHLIEQIDLEQTIQDAVRDALICCGAICTGFHRQDTVLGEGYNTGRIYARAVDLDDLIFDMSATEWEQVSFYGYRFRVPLRWVRENRDFDKKVREKIQATPKRQHNEDGDPAIQSLSQGEGDFDEYEDHVELHHLWLPNEGRNGTCLTLSTDDSPLLLLDEEYVGPPEGAMHLLGFQRMPKSIMPNSPANHWYDLHDCANGLLNKVIEGAEAQKDVGTYVGEAQKDAQRIVNARNLEMIKLDHPDGVQFKKLGGSDPATLATFLQIQELFNLVGGNLYSLGGLASQAGTLGQEQLMGANASKRVERMQKITYAWVQKVCKALDWYAWRDPLFDPPLTKEVGSGEDAVRVPARYDRSSRVGDPNDARLSIQPYSMQHRTPAEQFQVLSTFWQQFIAPMMQTGMLERAGGVVDVQGLLRTGARLMHFPFLEDLVKFGEVDPESIQGDQSPQRRGRMPAQTTRRYVREGRPGTTPQGAARQAMQSLLSMSSQQRGSSG